MKVNMLYTSAVSGILEIQKRYVEAMTITLIFDKNGLTGTTRVSNIIEHTQWRMKDKCNVVLKGSGSNMNTYLVQRFCIYSRPPPAYIHNTHICSFE